VVRLALSRCRSQGCGEVSAEDSLLLLTVRNVEAGQLTNRHFTWNQPAHGEGAQTHYGAYQGLGTPMLGFAASPAPVRDHRRSLELGGAMTRVSREQGGVSYRREMFVSAPAQVMVLHLSAGRAGALNFVVRIQVIAPAWLCFHIWDRYRYTRRPRLSAPLLPGIAWCRVFLCRRADRRAGPPPA